MNNLSKGLKELLCVLEVPKNSEITVEEKKPGFLDIAVNGTYGLIDWIGDKMELEPMQKNGMDGLFY